MEYGLRIIPRDKNKKMDNKKIKIIIISGIVALIALIVILVVASKARKPEMVATIEEPPLAEFEKNKIHNVVGKIISVSLEDEAMEIELIDGEKMTLQIPAGVSFIKQVKQADGSLLNESTGLFNIPENQAVDIQYDGQTNELMMIVVK